MVANEAFSRVRIDAQLRDDGWTVTDGRSVRFEHPLADGLRPDFVLCDEHGRPLAVLEAKRASASLGAAEPQAIAYARALGLDFDFLANVDEVRFRDLAADAHFRPVATVFAQADLAQRYIPRPHARRCQGLRHPPREQSAKKSVGGGHASRRVPPLHGA